MNFVPSVMRYQDPKKKAVVERYNELCEECAGYPVDFGMVFAELVAAYVDAEVRMT